jgi:lipoprotein signal peptidase
VGLGTTRFYTFNVADSCVTIGAVLLIFFSGSHGKPARPS